VGEVCVRLRGKRTIRGASGWAAQQQGSNSHVEGGFGLSNPAAPTATSPTTHTSMHLHELPTCA